MSAEIEQHDTHDDAIPFWPDHARVEFWVGMALLGIFFIVGILGQLMPVGLGEPANPIDTPLHVKPEWYFLGLYQLLKFVPKTMGVLIPIVGILILVIWPFLDRKPERIPKRARLIRGIAVVVFVVVYAGLTLWGELS
jgi:cytochrome b6-f complex subunit 4